jgi:hypothetical protein
MAAVPYIFAGQTGPIPLSELDVNFANVKQSTNTAITVTGNAQANINSVGVLTSLSVNGNVTTNRLHANGNATIAGTLATQGNISGNYLFGNGYFLTGISGGSGSNYSNANVAAYLPTYSGNIGAGNINAVTLTTQGNITGSYLFGNGSFLTGISGSNYSNANVAAYLPTYSGNIGAGNINVGGNINSNSVINAIGGIRSNGNILTTGIVSAGGNVFGNYLFGNGYFLNSVTITTTPSLHITDNLNVDQSTTLGGDTTIGGNLYVTGQVSIPGNINQVSGNSGQFFGNVQTGFGALYAGLPVGYANVPNDVFQLASNINDYAEMNFQNINGGNRATTDYVLTNDAGNNNVHFFNMGIASSTYDGTQAYNALGNSVKAHDGYLYVQGNVPGAGGNLVLGTNTLNQSINFVAGGGNTDNLSMVINAANLANTVTVSGGVTASGNILGANIIGTGNLSGSNLTATGNISGVNIIGTGNLSGGNLTATGNISGANIVSAGNVNGGNLTATGNISGANIVSAGNVNGGNLNSSNNIIAVGNISGTYILGNGFFLTGINNSNSNTNYSNANVAGFLPLYTGLLAGNGLTVTGAVNSDNVYSDGVVSAVGNITGAYFIGDGSLLANLPAGNYSNANVASYLPTYTGNLSPDTITTNGLTVLGSGAITGNATITGNIRSNNTISAAGNVTGANILSTGTISATGNIRGNYLFGNGFFLTGIPGGGNTGVTSISASSTVSGLTLTASPSTGAVNITLGGTAPTPTNMVTTNTAQTITGQKTFTTSVSANGGFTASGIVSGGGSFSVAGGGFLSDISVQLGPSPSWGILRQGAAIKIGAGPSSTWTFQSDSSGINAKNTSTWDVASDQRIKQNITPIDSTGLDKILALNPVMFQYKNEPGIDRSGFIAQEYVQVFPNAECEIETPEDLLEATNGDTKIMGLNVDLVPYLVKAIQELSAQNQLLTNQNVALEQRLAVVEAQLP